MLLKVAVRNAINLSRARHIPIIIVGGPVFLLSQNAAEQRVIIRVRVDGINPFPKPTLVMAYKLPFVPSADAEVGGGSVDL